MGYSWISSTDFVYMTRFTEFSIDLLISTPMQFGSLSALL